MFDDLRIALRTLVRSPGYTLVALSTLVLGIGANTSVFSIVNGVLYAPLGFPQEDQLVRVREVNGTGRSMRVAWPNFVDWQSQATRLTGMAAYNSVESTVLGTSEPLRVQIARVSADFFTVLGVRPALGRLPVPEDHQFGAAPVAVVSDRFWRSRLGTTSDLTSIRLTAGSHELRVVGVMRPDFDFPDRADIWYPLELNRVGDSRTAHNFQVLGRLAPDATLIQSDAELDAITARFAGTNTEAIRFLEYFPASVETTTLRDTLVGNLERPVWVLFCAGLLVLLVACTNLGSTTLARGTTREHEYAIRHALGAGRARMIRVLLAETVVLSAIGALAGLALAFVVVHSLADLAGENLPQLQQLRLNADVVGFTVLLSLVAIVLSGLLPGLRLASTASRNLRSGARTGPERGRLRVWKILIASECALVVILLTGAGLLLRSFWTMLQVQPGFATSGVLTATLNPTPTKYGERAARRTYYDGVLERLEALPGVESVGLTSSAPMSGIPDGALNVAGASEPMISADYQLVSSGYFRALHIPVLRGRVFDARDTEMGEPVALVNRAFAQQAWPGKDAIGQRLSTGGMEDERAWASVIGVVENIRQNDLTDTPRPTAYFYYRQRPYRSWSMTAILRPVSGQPNRLIPAVRSAVQTVDRNVPIEFSTIDERVADTLAPRRFLLTIIAAFGLIALVLAAIGLYGVVAYAGERRRREIGVRLALGAQPASIRGMMQREYMTTTLVGALAGTALALGLTRVLSSLLFEVKPTDPLTFVSVLGILGLIAWLASFIPALRSTRVNPLETMRSG